ncbi:ATP-dependent Clp protease proteolytic subunit [Enterococcus larvae]|uniref:Clp protease ClpP n=1 Tax=Enterococcus larvae TaxID=2794352 RepID=UPI003F30CF1F
MRKINLEGVVGWDFDAASVKEALSIVDGEDIEVEINSPGGAVFEGIAIMNALRGYKGKVTTLINGLAASAASYIFLAGEERMATEGSFYMIHNSATFMYGYYQRQDIDKVRHVTSKIDNTMAGFYKKYTNIKDVVRKMEDETFFDTDDMLADGIISRIGIASTNDRSNSNSDEQNETVENQGGMDQMFGNMTEKIRNTFINTNRDIFSGAALEDTVLENIQNNDSATNQEPVPKEEPVQNEENESVVAAAETEQFIAEFQQYTQEINNLADSFKNALSEVNASFASMKTEMETMRKEMAVVKQDREKLENEVKNFETEKEAALDAREKLIDEKQEKINNYFPSAAAETTNKWGAF